MNLAFPSPRARRASLRWCCSDEEAVMLRSARRELVLVFTLGIVVTSAGGQMHGQSASMRQQESPREAWQKVGEILAAMRIGSGSVVADVGAGDGFVPARLA